MKGLTEAHTCRLSSISTVLTAWLYVSDLFLLRCTLFKLPQLSRSTINILVKTATLVLIILGRAVSIFTGKKFLKSEFPPHPPRFSGTHVHGTVGTPTLSQIHGHKYRRFITLITKHRHRAIRLALLRYLSGCMISMIGMTPKLPRF